MKSAGGCGGSVGTGPLGWGVESSPLVDCSDCGGTIPIGIESKDLKIDFPPTHDWYFFWPTNILGHGYHAFVAQDNETGLQILSVKSSTYYLHSAHICLRLQGAELVEPIVQDGVLLSHLITNDTDIYTTAIYDYGNISYNPWTPEGLPLENCTSIQIVGSNLTQVIEAADFYKPFIRGEVPRTWITKIRREGKIVQYVLNNNTAREIYSSSHQLIREGIDKAYVGDSYARQNCRR